MLINAKRMICLVIITIILLGCSLKAVLDTDKEQIYPAEKSGHIFSQPLSDKDMFEDALSYLSSEEKEPNYNEVKTRLGNLVQQFPESKWITSAQALILCLDEISALQAKLKQEKQKTQTDQVKLNKEIEGLKDNIKQIEEKPSAEIIRLQQENEQLKNDIQQLKKLEIELEKREKMLR